MKLFFLPVILLLISSSVYAGYPARNRLIYPNQSYITKEKVVEFDADYYLGVDGYYSVGQKLVAEKTNVEKEKDAYYQGKIDALQDLVRQLQEGGGKVGGPPVNAIESKVFAIYQKYGCIKCHGATKPDGDFALVDGEGKLAKLSLAKFDNVLYRVDGSYIEDGDGKMPKGGKNVDDEDLASLKSYHVKLLKEELEKGQ